MLRPSHLPLTTSAAVTALPWGSDKGRSMAALFYLSLHSDSHWSSDAAHLVAALH